ncbi:MAG: glycerophosphodiester phosphodiesterase [Armatimonadaceae bacterium]
MPQFGRFLVGLIVIGAAGTAGVMGTGFAVPQEPESSGQAAKPVVIAHRGSSGMRPEHTLEAYTLAIAQGADFIEPDLVITKDGILVARHENEISGTTDVATRPIFADRRTTKEIDGSKITGWFTEDFTLAELKTLKAKERLPEIRPQSVAYNGQYQIPTFQEVIDLAKKKSTETGRTIGVYPETKHPSYFRSIGLPLEKPLVAILRKNGWDTRDAPVYIQSFEVSNLKELKSQVGTKLVQLIDTGKLYDTRAAGMTYEAMQTPKGLAEIATYAAGIGPSKDLIIPRKPDASLDTPTTLVRDAHAAGLVVHPWTFRSENLFLPKSFRRGEPGAEFNRQKGDFAAEYWAFRKLGVDGFFSDYPADARAALDTPHMSIGSPFR